MSEIVWRKSSRSGTGGTGGQECVEVAALSGVVGVRDSKTPDLGHLNLSPASFAQLVSRIKADDLNA
ncbi:DUF397 domain-containing protein [Actinomadura rubrisoli]|uniref:DUF397 domain-containing protein n=1 Tax=Actinomadura rubrisoli TaxID=2530368 RepID=A0A4R5BZ32_9ACTN|nr:DUF397 domain-containing protein [Actinomadura rubrisoli]TDD92491.1 DUF397 domain-containing protein [Actinomadura rubrisoli]